MMRLTKLVLLFYELETVWESIVKAFFRVPLDLGVAYSYLNTFVLSLIVKRDPIPSSL